MSSIFERTEVPNDSLPEYLEMAERLGVKLGKKLTTREDELAEITPEWTRQVTETKELLAQFEGSYANDRVADGVRKGLDSLVDDIHKSLPEGEKQQDIDLNAVKRALVEAFEGYLPGAVPDDIILNKGPKTSPGSFRRKQFSQIFTPRDVSITIQKYGLANGIQASIPSLASQFLISPARLTRITKDIPPFLGRALAISSVLFVRPPPAPRTTR